MMKVAIIIPLGLLLVSIGGESAIGIFMYVHI